MLILNALLPYFRFHALNHAAVFGVSCSSTLRRLRSYQRISTEYQQITKLLFAEIPQPCLAIVQKLNTENANMQCLRLLYRLWWCCFANIEIIVVCLFVSICILRSREEAPGCLCWTMSPVIPRHGLSWQLCVFRVSSSAPELFELDRTRGWGGGETTEERGRIPHQEAGRRRSGATSCWCTQERLRRWTLVLCKIESKYTTAIGFLFGLSWCSIFVIPVIGPSSLLLCGAVCYFYCRKMLHANCSYSGLAHRIYDWWLILTPSQQA